MKDNKIVLISLAVLLVVSLGISIFSITKNSSLTDYLSEMQSRTQNLTDELKSNRDELKNIEVQKDKLMAVLNQVSPWLDKDYYDSVVISKLDDKDSNSLFPPPPAITPKDLDNKLVALINALKSKSLTDKNASNEMLKKIEDLKTPVMNDIKKIFEHFDKLRADFGTISSMNDKLHKEKEELIISSNKRIEDLNAEISKLKEETSQKTADLAQKYEQEKSEIIKQYENNISSVKDEKNTEISTLKDEISKEKGTIKEELEKKLSQLQDLIAESNTLAEKSFDSYYHMKKKSNTGIFFSNKKILTDLEKEKDDFYSRFNRVKNASQKVFGLSKAKVENKAIEVTEEKEIPETSETDTEADKTE